uniref:Cytochrome P450 n=1 Tax=Oryza punctata TaxID=4537 RepID=A0A0E0M6T3_ORYPU
MAFFLVCMSSLLLMFFISYVLQLFGDSLRRLPPGPTPLPLIGNLLDIASDLPHRSLARLAGRHGPLMTVRLGTVVAIVASSPSTAREILQTHNGSLTGRVPPDAWHGVGHAANSVFVLPPRRKWRALRRIGAEHLLSARQLDGRLQPLLRVTVLGLLHRVSEMSAASGRGAPVQVGHAAFAAMMDMQWRAMFSAGLEDAQVLQDAAREAVALSLKPNLSDFFPVLAAVDLQGLRRRFARRVGTVYHLVDEQIERRMQRRREAAGDGAARSEDDLLDVLLDMSEHGKDDGKVAIDRDLIRTFLTVSKAPNYVTFSRAHFSPALPSQINTSLFCTLCPHSYAPGKNFRDIFLATVDTIASTLEWAMAELLQDRKTMRKLQEELKKVLGSKTHAEYADMDHLPYLRAVIKETLRLHPVVPLVPNVAEETVEIQGHVVPKGSTILVNLWAVHRDAEAWPEPNRFLPERFMLRQHGQEAADHALGTATTEFELIPFSAGRRVCLGLPLATRMLHAMLGSLLHRFKWTLPLEVEENGVDMSENLGLTMTMATPLQAIAKSI